MSSDFKKRKNKKQNQQNNDESRKLSKEDEAIAKYLKFNCPTRKANLVGMKVDYFNGSKAIDCLMNSKWATGQKNTQIVFPSRESCKHFLQELLNKELFHRAVKVYKDQVEAKSDSTPKNTPENTPKPRKRKSEKVEAATTAATNDDKSKRKFKLEMHDDQIFLDSNEPYVWIYDPATTKSLIVGSLLVIGSIGVCLFPLWPSIVREGVYYVSVAGAGFLGFILGLAVLKYILFAFIWLVTVGKVQFWLLPNLTEDVGFFESFKPFYKIKKNSSKTDTAKPSAKEETSKIEEKTKDDDFNKLPLDEQLMKKFDENIEDEEEDNGEDKNEDNVGEDYELVEEKDIDLKK